MHQREHYDRLLHQLCRITTQHSLNTYKEFDDLTVKASIQFYIGYWQVLLNLF